MSYNLFEKKVCLFRLDWKGNSFYYSTAASFYHIRSKERAKYAIMYCNYVLQCKIQVSKVFWPKVWKNKFWRDLFKWNNKLFDGLTYNTRGHFAHCSHFILAPSGLGKIQRNSQNILAYYMLNHRIRCIYSICEDGSDLIFLSDSCIF